MARIVQAARSLSASSLSGASHRQLASTAVVLGTTVVLVWGFIILNVPRLPPRVPVPAVEGLLVRIERVGSWNDWLEVDGDGAVRYFVRKDGWTTLRGEGHLSGAQLEEISKSFAIAEFCEGPPNTTFVAYPAGSSDWFITYFGCSPPRTLRGRQLPHRGWWWSEEPWLPWSVFEITGVARHLRNRKASY